jgi:hypothetical protein
MADNFNHENRNVGWGLCHKSLQLKGDPRSYYFLSSRFMSDLSAIFEDRKTAQLFTHSSSHQKEQIRQNICGFVNQELVKKHNTFLGIETWREQFK